MVLSNVILNDKIQVYSNLHWRKRTIRMDVLFFSTIADQVKKEINHKCGLNISQTRILLFFDENKNQALAMGKLAEALNISLSILVRVFFSSLALVTPASLRFTILLESFSDLVILIKLIVFFCCN